MKFLAKKMHQKVTKCTIISFPVHIPVIWVQFVSIYPLTVHPIWPKNAEFGISTSDILGIPTNIKKKQAQQIFVLLNALKLKKAKVTVFSTLYKYHQRQLFLY